MKRLDFPFLGPFNSRRAVRVSDPVFFGSSPEQYWSDQRPSICTGQPI